jgi:ubiquinone/menaquinone biosynthesis C-methylase UbiE
MPVSYQIKQINIELHDRTADLFEEKNIELFNPYEQHYINERIEKSYKTCSKTQVCCDLSCGTGSLVKRHIHRFKVVVGLDISREMLKKCKAKSGGGEIHLILADSECLPFRDAIFDMVTIHAALHHLPSTLKCFMEIYRSLSRDGVMYIDHEPNSKSLRTATEKIQGALSIIEHMYERKRNPNFKPFSNILVPAEYALADVHCTAGFHPDVLQKQIRPLGFRQVEISYHNIYSSFFFKLQKPLQNICLVDVLFDRFPLINRFSSHICIWARK